MQKVEKHPQHRRTLKCHRRPALFAKLAICLLFKFILCYCTQVKLSVFVNKAYKISESLAILKTLSAHNFSSSLRLRAFNSKHPPKCKCNAKVCAYLQQCSCFISVLYAGGFAHTP